MMEKAFYVTTDGRIEEILPANGKDFKLEEVQKRVEGYIEIVYLQNNLIMIINDEGKYDKPFNALATVAAHHDLAIADYDYICGDVVICPSSMLA